MLEFVFPFTRQNGWRVFLMPLICSGIDLAGQMLSNTFTEVPMGWIWMITLIKSHSPVTAPTLTLQWAQAAWQANGELHYAWQGMPPSQGTVSFIMFGISEVMWVVLCVFLTWAVTRRLMNLCECGGCCQGSFFCATDMNDWIGQHVKGFIFLFFMFPDVHL